MKFLHISDLHLGKRVNEYSMIDDQKFILTKIINIVDEIRPDCVFIAGDIYDKSVPSAEAVQLFDDFLTRLSERNKSVFVISGNHDSPERIAFGSRLLNKNNIYLSPVYDGNVTPVVLDDEYGAINIYMLPFIKPQNVRRFSENEIHSYTEAVQFAIDKMNVNTSERNIIITHQFVTGATRSDSEEISVGGSDNVDASVFSPFDYVALGHIHSPQNCGSNNIRYSGTPLKYSFSEANDIKSVTVGVLKEKGNLEITTLPLIPYHDMREIKGSYDEITRKSFYEHTTYQSDYMHITLTDEQDIPDAISKLRTIYKNIMKLDYDNSRTRQNNIIDGVTEVENKSPMELFSDFFFLQNNIEMSQEQKDFVSGIIEQVWGEEI